MARRDPGTTFVAVYAALALGLLVFLLIAWKGR